VELLALEEEGKFTDLEKKSWKIIGASDSSAEKGVTCRGGVGRMEGA